MGLSTTIVSVALLWLVSSVGVVAGSTPWERRQSPAESEFPWASITPSKNLTWTPCYTEPLECARLEVPLDYSNPNGRQAAIALVRRPATDRENYKGPVLLNPGGPGGGGVNFVVLLGEVFSIILGPQFDIVGFDPRGIAKSTPRASYVRTDVERAIYMAGIGEGPIVKNGTVTNIQRAWARGHLLGAMAAKLDDGYLQHITTENTATDMLTIARAHGREKVQFWGISYGSVLGATFAAMYPDKVERLVIDGVMDAEDYYSTGWLTNTLNADKAMQYFYDSCADAGPSACAFYSPDPADIKRNLTALYDRVQREPAAVVTDDFYGLVDYAQLHFIVFNSLYGPYSLWRSLGSALAQFAAGNATALFLMEVPPPKPYVCSSDPHAHDFDEVPEGRATLACNDGDVVPPSLDATQEHWNKLAEISEFADIWGYVPTDCVNWPKNKKPFRGPFVGNTSHPLLLIGNTLDPATPIESARKMAQGFEGAVVLTIDGPAHSSLNAPSTCAQQHVREYFLSGTLPPQDTVCQPNVKNPFLFPPPSGQAGVAGREISSREDAKLLKALTEAAEKAPAFFTPPRGGRV